MSKNFGFIDYNTEKDFWFNEIEKHGRDVFNYGKNYYISQVFDILLPNIIFPQTNKICMLGTHNCYSFSKLEEIYGAERCIGFDLYNPTMRNNIVVGPIADHRRANLPKLAFCWNDLGNYSRTPRDKMIAQIRFANLIVKDGIYISRDGSNRARFPVEVLMEELGFENKTLFEYFNSNNIDCQHLDQEMLQSHLISRRIKLGEY